MTATATHPRLLFDGVWKKFHRGELHDSLRDLIPATFRRLTGREAPATDLQGGDFWAVRDLSFEVTPGTTLGIIGPNGSGKSTTLKLLTRIYEPTRGVCEAHGRIGTLIEVSAGFHGDLTGRENVFLQGAIMGMRSRDIQRKFDEIVDFSGISEFIDTPVKRYSSGMYVRLAFSVAAHLEPDILLVDEVLAVGDAEFQQRSLGRMETLSGAGRTVLFVSHNMQAINQLCDRAILLDGGRVVEDGHTSTVVTRYLHSALRSGSHIEWPDDESAPGDTLARLLSVRVVDEDGQMIDTADVRRPVGIEIGFRVLREGPPVFAKIKVSDNQGAIAFNAMDVSAHWHDSSVPGQYVATGWIAGNLLNEGRASVEAGVWSLHGAKLLPRGHRYDAVSFNVYDPADGDSARGRFVGQLRGVVRPLLEWNVEQVD
jgi:lipopolysaccharide transport system ATP-binding protein